MGPSGSSTLRGGVLFLFNHPAVNCKSKDSFLPFDKGILGLCLFSRNGLRAEFKTKRLDGQEPNVVACLFCFEDDFK